MTSRRTSPAGLVVAILALVAVVAVIAAVAITRSTVTVAGTAVASTDPGSDEDQIRTVVAAFETAWNDGDYSAFRPLLCTQVRDDDAFSRSELEEARGIGGRLDLRVESVAFSGNSATADISNGGENNQDIEFIRQDGSWKWCEY